MAAGFGALRNDCVHTALLQRPGLRHRGSTGDSEDPGALDGLHDLGPRQTEMKAHHLWLRAQEHRQVLATDLACSSLRLGNRTQAFGIVVRLQTPSHRLACLRRDPGFRPERIVDVQAAAALLPETGNATFGILGGKSPHSDAAEATGIAHGSSESGPAEPAHR